MSNQLTLKPRTIANDRGATGQTGLSDLFILPAPGGTADGFVTLKLIEVPMGPTGSALTIYECGLTGATMGVEYAGVYGSPAAGQYQIQDNIWTHGLINIGYFFDTAAVLVSYEGIGSMVSAEDINELADGTLIEDGAILGRHIGELVAPVGTTGMMGHTGAIWFDPVDSQYKGYNGTNIVVIG